MPHFNRSFDLQMGYRTMSILAIPMLNHRHEVVGVLEFINRQRKGSESFEPELIAFDEEIAVSLRALASQAAVAIENRQLLDDISRLFDGFVQRSTQCGGRGMELGQRIAHQSILVDNLTQSYKAVYDHLEGGAYQLVGDEKFRKQLEQRKQLQLEDSFSARREPIQNVVVDDSSDDPDSAAPVTKVQAEEVDEDTESVETESEKVASYPRSAPNRKRPTKTHS